jgi:cytochrome c oxidase cbb3-type subunit 3/ubiquinol-cytochrome c reductase cytochrome c subunit
VPADQVLDFGKLYKTNCAGCHGADGKLGPAPPLNDSLFLAIVPDKELLAVITEGRAVSPAQKTPMPAFGLGKAGPLPLESASVPSELAAALAGARQQGALTDAQIKVLAEGIKTHWGPPASLRPSVPAYRSAAGSRGGDKDRGAHVFARACAGCHGKDGQGVEREHRLDRKIHDPAFLALISDQALRRYIITGRPDLGMPAYDGKKGRPEDFQALTSAQIDDLVALLANWRRGGAAKGR